MERIENDWDAKRVYVGESAGSHSVGRLQKRFIDTMKINLNIRQAGRMEHDRNEWQEFVRGICRALPRG